MCSKTINKKITSQIVEFRNTFKNKWILFKILLRVADFRSCFLAQNPDFILSEEKPTFADLGRFVLV